MGEAEQTAKEPRRRLKLRAAREDISVETRPWRILVVDDDPQVHSMTAVLLRDFRFQGRGFQPISAFSATEARVVLETQPDIPVMLLDVVMETDHAGLSLARAVRQDLGNHRLRIILRTGQPGEAPERDVMVDYDINDYRSKTELTAQKLFTTLVGALRSWQHIDTIETLNATLESKVAERTRELGEARAFSERLIELLPQPLWVKDIAGRYKLYNKAFRDFFGIGQQDWVGNSAEAMLGGTMPHEELLTDCAVLDGTNPRPQYETQLSDAQGQPRTLLVTKAALPTDGVAPSGIIGIATDITERKLLEHDLHRLASQDPLTGVANLRHFNALACREMELAHRHGQPLSVIMFDVDHFKRVNDTWGHAAGDLVLKALIEALGQELRETDLMGRVGGEEFAVLLPLTEIDGAWQLAERLRQAADCVRVALPSGLLRVTISLGVTQRKCGENDFQHLLSRADHAMYQAKRGGRNQVTRASA